MARKVLSWSLRFCITPKSSLKFAEIRYVSLGSLRFVKVHQKFAKIRRDSPRAFKFLLGSPGFCRALRGTEKDLKNTNMFCKILSASGSFHWVHKRSFHYEVLPSSTRILQVPSSPTMVLRVPQEFPLGSNMVPLGVDCEGGGDVVGVLTLLVGGVAQAFHDDQVVELRVQLGVEEVEGKDREEQVEVEREKRVKEVRPWI